MFALESQKFYALFKFLWWQIKWTFAFQIVIIPWFDFRGYLTGNFWTLTNKLSSTNLFWHNFNMGDFDISEVKYMDLALCWGLHFKVEMKINKIGRVLENRRAAIKIERVLRFVENFTRSVMTIWESEIFGRTLLVKRWFVA